MKAVLYVTRMVPHYRKEALTLLNTRLGGRLVVCAGQPPQGSSLGSLVDHEAPPYDSIPLHNLWIGGQRLHAQPFGTIVSQYPRPSVLIAEESVRSLTLPALLRRARRAGAARLLWGHFSSNTRAFAPHMPSTRYRIALARSVEGCICYSQPVADQLQPFVPSTELFVAPNTLDTGKLLSLYGDLEQEGRTAVRERLGLPASGPIVTYLGRLIKAKGLRRLVDVFGLIQERHPQATLVVIGDGPERTRLARYADRHGGVHLLGALTDWSVSAPYLYASDVLLNPGYLGLSINHAFALGLPVVTQRSPNPRIRYHSPEIAYLEHGETGLLCPFGDVAEMANAVEVIMADRDRYSRQAADYARRFLGLDVMVDGIVRAVEYAEGTTAE